MRINNKGFTLIELMFVIVLAGILLLAMGNLLNYNFQGFSKSNNSYKYKLEAKYAMNKVVSEIRKQYSTIFESGKVKASDTSIIVNSNPNDETGSLYYYFDSNRYGVGDGYGEIRRLGGASVAKNIKDFKIEDEGNGLIKITIKTGKENNSKIYTLTTYIRLYS